MILNTFSPYLFEELEKAQFLIDKNQSSEYVYLGYVNSTILKFQLHNCLSFCDNYF